MHTTIDPSPPSDESPPDRDQSETSDAAETSETMDEVRDRHQQQVQALVVDAEERADRQNRRGKLSAQQRIEMLLDPGSFRAFAAMRKGRQEEDGGSGALGDGVITGYGTIHGTKVLLFAQDFTVRGGSLGATHADKILYVLRMAERLGVPVVGLYDGGGARIDEGAMALDGCGKLFSQIVRLSGFVPQISVVLGPCAGAAAYAPALTDAVFMVRDIGMMYLTGPDVVTKVTGEQTDGPTLGGADVHGSHSGVATFVYDDEQSCLDDVRYLVSLLPAGDGQPPDRGAPDPSVDRPVEELGDLVPADTRLAYDMHTVIDLLTDEDSFIEFHEHWADNVICGLARIDGHVAGMIANQPAVRAGVLDAAASEKAARFVTWCNAFSIPLVTLVDVPGFMPGVEIEREGVIRYGARLLHAYCDAVVPRIQVILRKAYGGAYIVMDSPSTGNDLSFAWPTNEVAVMGPEAAVEIIHRRQIASAVDSDAARQDLLSTYRERHLDPYRPAHEGLVDEVIDPAQTRHRVAEALELLVSKAARPRLSQRGVAP